MAKSRIAFVVAVCCFQFERDYDRKTSDPRDETQFIQEIAFIKKLMIVSSGFSIEIKQGTEKAAVHHNNTSCKVGKNIEKIIIDTARTIDLCANNAPG